jgi:hypothetical protein
MSVLQGAAESGAPGAFDMGEWIEITSCCRKH